MLTMVGLLAAGRSERRYRRLSGALARHRLAMLARCDLRDIGINVKIKFFQIISSTRIRALLALLQVHGTRSRPYV